jgi:deoxyribonuclease-4
VAFGANRDRHANLGSGTIGDAGLAALLGHPKLQGMAAVLEVPGDGSGPTAAEVARAKALVVRGVGDRNERRSGVR